MATKATITDQPAPSLTLLPGGSMTLIDLFTGLEAHAARLGASPSFYSRVPGWPSRLLIPTSMIVAGRWQPRSVFVDAEINDLAESIGQLGIINPLMVFVSEHGKFELIAGERRLRAASIAGLNMVPVEVVEGTPDQLEDLSVIDNIQRQNLTAWDEGAAFERMITGQKISEAELARRMGKNRAYIQQRRALASAAPTLIKALSDPDSRMTFAMARGIIAGAGASNVAGQSAGVAAVLDALKVGKPMDEAKAKIVAADAAHTANLSTVTALGWSVYQSYDHKVVVVWAPGERPVQVDAAMVSAIATAGKKPAGTPPDPWERDEDVVDVLRMRGLSVVTNQFAPWIAVHSSTHEIAFTFYRADEMPAAARSAMADIDEMERRANDDAGWEIRRPTPFNLFFVRADQTTKTCYSWSESQEMLAQLLAGTVATMPRERCAQCNEYIDTGAWILFGGGNRIHIACKDAALESERQRIIATPPSPVLGRPELVLPAWMKGIPEKSLRALVWTLSQGDEGGAGDSLLYMRQTFCRMVAQAESDFDA
jgi:ParB/RepB/Spo0J family partition protein